jgi:hypothetical protein
MMAFIYFSKVSRNLKRHRPASIISHGLLPVGTIGLKNIASTEEKKRAKKMILGI